MVQEKKKKKIAHEAQQMDMRFDAEHVAPQILDAKLVLLVKRNGQTVVRFSIKGRHHSEFVMYGRIVGSAHPRRDGRRHENSIFAERAYPKSA